MFEFFFGNDYNNSMKMLIEMAEERKMNPKDLLWELNKNPDLYGPAAKEAWNCIVQHHKRNS